MEVVATVVEGCDFNAHFLAERVHVLAGVLVPGANRSPMGNATPRDGDDDRDGVSPNPHSSVRRGKAG